MRVDDNQPAATNGTAVRGRERLAAAFGIASGLFGSVSLALAAPALAAARAGAVPVDTGSLAALALMAAAAFCVGASLRLARPEPSAIDETGFARS